MPRAPFCSAISTRTIILLALARGLQAARGFRWRNAMQCCLQFSGVLSAGLGAGRVFGQFVLVDQIYTPRRSFEL